MVRRVITVVAVTLTAALLPGSLRAGGSESIRVGLLREQAQVTIASERSIIASSAAGQSVLAPGSYEFVSAGGVIELVGGTRFEGLLRLTPTGGVRLSLNNRTYRGILELRAVAAGRLTVINELPLEQYLYGVIKMEVDPRWPPETLKAQAVAARTLALHSLNRFRSEGYDVRATTESQVYGGILAEDARATAAVEDTRGLVMTYRGSPILAVYHADSGGHTESSEYVWGGAHAYLRGIPDPYSSPATGREWVSRIELGVLEERLRRAGKLVSGITAIELAALSPSGRVLSVAFQTSRGSVEVKATDLRAIIGPEALRSTLFTIRFQAGEATTVEFTGRGSGHGVGMSQWGARTQGLQGRTFLEILRYYYADVAVEQR